MTDEFWWWLVGTNDDESKWALMKMKLVIQMSEVHLRHRIVSARAVAREAPVKSMTGFAVESKKSLGYPSKNKLSFVDGKAVIIRGDE